MAQATGAAFFLIQSRRLQEELIVRLMTLMRSGICLAALTCAGCGSDGPEISDVQGTVTMDGKPLANAAVLFIPDNGRPAGASTDAEGKYVLNFSGGRQGAIPGKSRVLVTTRRDPSETEDGKPIPGSPETIPMKYNAKTILEFTVKPGEPNVANFDLKSEGRLVPEAD